MGNPKENSEEIRVTKKAKKNKNSQGRRTHLCSPALPFTEGELSEIAQAILARIRVTPPAIAIM